MGNISLPPRALHANAGKAAQSANAQQSKQEFTFNNEIVIQTDSGRDGAIEMAQQMLPIFKQEAKKMIIDEFRPGGSLYRK